MGVISVNPSSVQPGEYVRLTIESYVSLANGTEYYVVVNNSGNIGYLDTLYGTYIAYDALSGEKNTIDYYVQDNVYGDIDFTLYLSEGNTRLDRCTLTVEDSGSSSEFAIDYIGEISSHSSAYIDNYQILMYSYTPTATGTLKWYSSGDIDVYGWISDEAYCDLDSDGYPTSCIACDDDSAGNRNFSMSITASANTTYYLYARCYNSSNSGSVTLYVDFQPSYSLSSGGTLTTSTYTHLGSYNIVRFTYTPTVSGTLIWSASTGVNTVGWISNSTSWNVDSYGQPYSGYYIGSYNGDYNGTAFRATATVTAGTTYYLYACGYSGSGGYVTLTATVRPNDWAWTSTIAQNRQIKLTASEWNNFTARINQFRAYKGLSAYSFTTAVKNSTPIEAGICNQARTAIDAISGHGTLPTALVSGGTLYASFFNGLKNALNAIS